MKKRSYRIYPFLIALLIGFFTLSACNGQVKSNQTEHTSNKKQLGQIVTEINKSVWSIFQDHEEHYWFGSNGKGVYFYDGKKIINFTKEDGLVDNQIRGIQGDKLGNVYFDTQSGVSKYDGSSFQTLVPIYDDKIEWKSEPNDIWFKGSGNINGVYRYDGKKLYLLSFPEQDLKKGFGIQFEESRYSPYGVYSIYKDQSENMWFGTLAAGVFRFNGKSFSWIAEKELTILENGQAPGVRSIIEDKDGNFWLSNILYKYQVNESDNKLNYEKLDGISVSEQKEKVEFPYFMSSLIDNNQKDLWMITYSQGVWRYDGKKLTRYILRDEGKKVFLFSLYKDHQGTIWIGSHTGAIFQFDGNSFQKVQF